MASDKMNEKFSAAAVLTVDYARDEALRLKHDYMGTEHLLLGLTLLRGGRGIKILTNIGMNMVELRQSVEDVVQPGDDVIYLQSSMSLLMMLKAVIAHKIRKFRGPPRGPLPVTARLKKVFELSVQEANAFGAKEIGSGHLLLGLLREEEGVAAQVLSMYEVDYKKAYGEFQKIIRDEGGQK
jgi:ATP-dependent Clp protease ATP-binding subunit ClpC